MMDEAVVVFVNFKNGLGLPAPNIYDLDASLVLTLFILQDECEGMRQDMAAE